MKQIDFVADLMRKCKNPTKDEYNRIVDTIREAYGVDRGRVIKMFHEARLYRDDLKYWHLDNRINKNTENIPQKCEKTIYDDKIVVSTDGGKVRTVKDVIRYAEIDTKIFQAKSPTINFWDVTTRDGSVYTNYQIKVVFERIVKTFVEEGFIELLEEFRKQFKWNDIQYIRPSGDLLLEICLFDSHFGKLAWKPETGDSSDIKRTAALYDRAPDEILSLVGGHRIAKIVLPIGSDFFHINNSEGTTAKGTSLDVDSRFKKIFKVGCESAARVVEKLSRIAPVEVLWIPGNHDRETSFFLAMFLSALFENNPNVTVDIGEKNRKYYLWGKLLLGYTHGSEEKKDVLPLLMASEEPEKWAKSKRREFHIGHWHKRKEMQYLPLDTFAGVVVRTIPSLCGTDSWHYEKGFVNAGRVAQAFLWHKSGSLISLIETPIEMPDWIEETI